MATNDFTKRYLERRRELGLSNGQTTTQQTPGRTQITTPASANSNASNPASQGTARQESGNSYTSGYLAKRRELMGGGVTGGQTRPSATLPSIPSLSSSLRRFTPTQLLQDVLKQSETTRPAGGQTTTPTETMSSADMSARLDELRELRDTAEADRNEARTVLTGVNRYGTQAQREEWNSKLEQAEADYSRYDQEYNELLDRYYQTENEEKRTSLQQDEAMSGQYQSAQDIQSDMDKVSAVMAYTVTHDGDAAQVEEYKQYLFDKYGLDQKAVDQYAISGAGGAYVPRTDGGYNNIYELYLELQEKKENAVSTLSEGGYDYERMTGYEDMLEDAAQYREDMEEWQEYAREHPILSSVDTLLTAPFQGFDFLRVMGQNIGHSDRDDPENYVPMNSYDMELTNYINAVRQTVSEEIEGATNWEIFDQNVAAFLYQTGMSIGDSSLNLLAFGPTGALVVGSSTAAANQAKDIIDRGGSKEQAFMGGMAAGAFEAIFEKVSIDNLLATKSVTGWKSWLKETAKQAGIEASEETFTEIANILADAAIMGDNSNYDVAVAEYVAQGMSQEDAERQAFFDLIGQVVQAGVGGAISGGVMGGAVNGVNGMANAAYNRYNQQLVRENDVKNTPVLETNPQEGPVQSQNEGEIDSSIPEATRQAVEMLVRGEEISGNQAARIAESEEAVALLSRLTGEEVNTDAPISRVKSDIRALASRDGRTSGGTGVNSRATQNVAQTQEQAQERPAAMQAYDVRRMEQAAQAGGFGESGRRALLAAYDGSVDGTSFYTGFSSYYNAGLSGMDMGKVQSIYAQDLTEAQRYAAYTAGQNDAAASLQREKAGVQFVPVYGDEAGLVDNDNAKRVPQQTAALYNTLAKAAGVKIELVDEITTPDGGRGGNGLYIPSRNTIQISMDTEGAVGADGKLDAGAFAAVAAHEITHRIQDLAPEQYRAYRDYAMNAMAQAQGYGTTANLVEGKLREYAEGGVNLTAEQAMDEIAADFTRDMIQDAGLFKELAQEHRSVARRVLDALKDFIRRVKAAFSSRVAQDRAARSEYGVDMDTLEEAARLWQRAYDAATAQASGKSKSADQADGAGRFSIRYDQDNNPYVVIEEDILAGVPRSEWVRTVKDNLRQKFPNGVTVGRNVIEIDKQSRREMTFSNYMQRLMRTDRQIFADKLRATNNADEILRAARNWVNEALLHPRRDAIIDFARGEVLMRIGRNDYAAQVIVGNRGGGNLLLYDIINLEQTEIQEKRTGTDYTQKPREGATGRQSAPASDDSISETGGDVNGKYSLKERDREYLSAVESGNTQEAQRLVDEAAEAAMPESKIRGQDGRLTPVYHGTRDMFWRFDTAVKGGVNGTAEGFGIYTSDNPAVTSAYGDRQLKMFANITHPATSTEKTITPKTLAALIKDTCEREARQQVADGEYDSVREALRDTWVSNYTDTYSAPMPHVYREVARSILDMNESDMEVIQEVMTGMGIRDYADATSFYENSLIPVTGIDGFVTQWESGDTGERSNIILALNSSQLKSADAVTRDDSGNVIPLSERFDPSEGDIRYSLKSTDSRGRELSEEQRRYFQGSKITDADGRLLVLYHGTTAYGEITKFRRGRSGWLGPGIYLASRQADAKRYADAMGEGNGQLYELYANATNPLVVTEGNPVPEILRAAYGRDSVYRSRSAKQGNDAQIITTADIKKLQSKGYDGIRWDFGGSTEVSVFSPEQIKRVDNLTPSGSQDVRYSLKAEDSQGRELTQEQQEFFRDSKAVDNQGRLLVLYHGTASNFTVFDRERITQNYPNNIGDLGFYFTPYQTDARGYAGNAAGRVGGGSVMQVYLNLTNPLVVEDDGWGGAANQADARHSELLRWARAGGHDGIIVRSTDFEMEDGEYDAIYVAFSPEQIKNTDNLNPTSDPDIRRSIKGGDILRQNAALQEENSLLRERVEYWRGQTRRTERVTTDKKAVERAARELIRAYNSSLETAEIAGDLQSLYDYIASGRDGSDELTYTEARRRSDAIARKLVDSAAVLEDDAYRDYADLRSYLRSTPLSISAEDSHDIADFGDFRRRNFGRMTIRSGPTNIDQVYQEMSDMWPEFFDETRESTPSDQLVHIAEVLDGIYRVTERNPFSGYFDAAVTDASNEIMERFFDLPQTRPTFADRQARKLDDAKAAGRRRLAEQRERSDARLNELRQQNRERVQRAIQRERETRARQIDRLKTRYAARDAAGRERRSARELRARISRHVADLSRRLLRPSDKQHIPEQLRTAVAAMLDAINLESVYTVDPETGRRRKGGNGDPTKRTEAFRALREQYAKIIAEGGDMVIDPLLMGNDAEGIRGSFDAVIAMGDTRLADMSTQQLEIVWQVVKAVEQSVSTAGKILSKAKFAETAEWANAMQRDTAGRRAKQSLTKGHPLIDLETPYTFFSHFGDAGRDIYRMLRDAQDQQQLMADEVAATVRSIISPKEVRKLERTTQTFTTERGDNLTLSTAQIMELYELTQREQAHDHLLKGGVVQPEIESAKIRRGTDAILLTEGDLASIVGTLTDQQKQTADKLQRLTTGLLADYGNQASMAAYGYRKFTEDHYWLLHSAKEGIRSSVERGSGQTRSIANIGLAQAVIPHANNPLDLPGLFSTFSSHAGDMIDYAAWLLPMEDANRLFNFKFRDGEGNLTGRSVKGLLDRVGGEGSQRYWHNLMEDIQNGINAPGDSPMWDKMGKSIGSFKGAAVGGNLRVIIQQPTAFFRAGMVLSPADLSRGLARGVTRGNGWRKALQYSPIAKRKNTGSFDISSPRQMNEILFDDRSGVRKLNDALSAPAGMADAVTWGKLWNACEWATAREHKSLRKGSEAFYQKVNELFTGVIDQTQVVDGVLQRSNIMRSSNAVVKQATSFMGEPIMSLNLMMRAYDQVRYEQNPKKRGRAIKMLGRAATALVVTNTVNALAQSIIDAIRDDDKDKKYWERFWSAFTGLTGEEESAWDKAVAAVFNGNLGGNMNLLGQAPFVKDVLSLAQGYDVSRTDMEIFSDLVRAAQTAMRSADGTGPKTRAYAVKELLSAGAKMFGIPVGNLARDAWGIARSIAAETDNIPLQYEMEKAIYNITNEGNTKRYLDLLYQAQKSGDKAVYEHIYTDLVASGITEEKIRAGMESRMKEDQGVESVDELSRRYLTPNQERTYDRLYDQVSSSPVWRAASPEQREAVEEDIYDLTTGTDAGVKLQEKIDGGAAYGITEADYLLYLAAREIADGENEDRSKRNGSIDQAEAQAAIDMLTGLSDEGRAYLWQSTNKGWSEEKNPYR